MDLGLKGKVAMVAGASRGLGFAVAQALVEEGAIVSISSRRRERDSGCGGPVGRADARHGGRRQVRRRDTALGERDDRAIRRRRSAVRERGRTAGGSGAVLRRHRLAGCGEPAAVQHAADDAGRRALDEGARRWRDPRSPLRPR